MEEYDKRRFQSIAETDRFFNEHDPPGSAIAVARRRLRATRITLEKLIREETNAKVLLPADGKEIRKLCGALRKGRMMRVSRAAKRIRGFDKFTPGAAAALRVPHARSTADILVPAAERMAKWLKPHVRAFVEEAGFEKTFIAELRDAAKRLKERAGTSDSARRTRTAAIRAIKRELTHGRQDIDLLRVLMEPWIEANDRVELQWNDVTRVKPKLGRPKKKRRSPGAGPESVGVPQG